MIGGIKHPSQRDNNE
ncbi:hypothetical protein YPPY48_1912, partial [Yersinia pestis PY-48]